jgi:arylsulfatase B
LPSGAIKTQYFHITDLLPTLLTLADAGVRVGEKIDGIDLSEMIRRDRPPYRNEIVTVDDVHGYGSYIYTTFKLVNGSSNDGGEADGWIGSNNNSNVIGFREYIDGVLNSKVARVLENYGNGLMPETILDLRENATIKCSGEKVGCDLLKGPCLFNILKDPCEETNLASSNPMLLKAMEKIYHSALVNLVPSHRKPSDPRCDPANFNFTWNWWE